MAHALKTLQLDPEGLRVLDIGISTGGFADCLLQAGAKEVVGVDVGHGQLAETLKSSQSITLYEGVNAKNLDQWKENIGLFDLIVLDLSFISLKHVLPHLQAFLLPQGRVLALVKPQFELTGKSLNKSGVVKDSKDYDLVEKSITELATELGLHRLHYFSSEPKGDDGNQEFFIYLSHSTSAK